MTAMSASVSSARARARRPQLHVLCVPRGAVRSPAVTLPRRLHLPREEVLGHLGLDVAVRLADLCHLVHTPLCLVRHLDRLIAHARVAETRLAAGRARRAHARGAPARHRARLAAVHALLLLAALARWCVVGGARRAALALAAAALAANSLDRLAGIDAHRAQALLHAPRCECALQLRALRQHCLVVCGRLFEAVLLDDGALACADGREVGRLLLCQVVVHVAN
mmetsp:Transcript_2195/g.5844  ORF Transcript_2195/g.5844 Transcript_2195/m.5844 type:complete len:224 (+) Transcript_2195:396-1067(+)